MLAFIDESGDPGRKIDRGSSPFFTVAMVTFDENEMAAACDERISLLRYELSLPKEYEFHFMSNSRRVRLAFLEAVAPYEFFYHAFVLNKDPNKLYGPGFNFKGSLYKYVCGLVFENAKPYLADATVIIDKSGDREFRNRLAVYLRRKMGEGGRNPIQNIKMEQSRSNNLIQLADYVAGVANRWVNKRPDATMYRRVIASREIQLRVWPR
jgi:hypothetical protein